MLKNNKNLILLSLFFSIVFSIAFFYFLKEKKEIQLIDLQGSDFLQALKWIEANSLQVKIFEKVDLNSPSYLVLTQNPAPGTMVKENRKITLVVNSNKVNEKMPDFLGKTFEEAKKSIYNLFSRSDFIPQIIRQNRFSQEYSSGEVMAQKPAPESIFNQTDSIVLVVSKGKALGKVVVEDYQFKDFRQVEEDLSSLGIYVKATFSPTYKKNQVGKIFKQSIKPGEVLEPQEEIAFLVGEDGTKANGNEDRRAILRIAEFQVPNTKISNNVVSLW